MAIYSHGVKDEGEFKNNSPNGQGVMTYADGEKKIGLFKDGSFVAGSVPVKPEVIDKLEGAPISQ